MVEGRSICTTINGLTPCIQLQCMICVTFNQRIQSIVWTLVYFLASNIWKAGLDKQL